MNKSQFRILSALFLFACGVTAAQDKGDVEYKRVSISGQFDNGQIIKGNTSQYENTLKNENMDGAFIQRTGVWITQEAIVKERLHLTMGVGGLFWYVLPVSPNSALRQTQFGPGISQAQAVYTFGDLADPIASLQMGYFPYKYNSDAKNLGEYLMRSGTYPGYLVTGGWNMLNSAGYMVQGFRLNAPLFGGKVQADFLLAMEHDLPPLFGITPAVVLNATPVEGVKLGAGAACNHCIPIKPSRETPHIGTGENNVIKSVTYDTTTGSYTVVRDSNSYYTFQGVKLMASASFDPKAFFPMPMLGSEDLKIYSEVALLGVKNYGYLYEDRLERMPVMVGLNLPTFKMLDVLSFEVEYYNSKFVNDFTNLVYGQVPTWNIPESDTPEEHAQRLSDVKRDNWKWSVYSKKTITKGIDIYAQAASDHFRTIQLNGGPLPTMVPVTNRNGKDWYYIIRLQFGI